VLSLLGTVEDEVLFRLCDYVVDQDTAGALVFLEELSEQGQDLGRLVVDLLEHLRHLMLVQATGEVPDTLPVTDEARERLREQANQLGPPTVLRLIDLLHVAVEDMRQGGDPRLPLELALVKVTRPGADLSRESLAYRVEQLERVAPRGGTPSGGGDRGATADPPPAADNPEPAAQAEPVTPPPSLELEQLQEAWRRSVLPAVEARSIPASAMLAEAHPAALEGDTLTLEFLPEAGFHREKAEEPKSVELLRDALYEVTGRRLELSFTTGERLAKEKPEPERPASEEEIVELMKTTFDAQELEL
jgi:DNA polymerase-3 subunit gamma/tau